jgi:hypothetical protein
MRAKRERKRGQRERRSNLKLERYPAPNKYADYVPLYTDNRMHQPKFNNYKLQDVPMVLSPPPSLASSPNNNVLLTPSSRYVCSRTLTDHNGNRRAARCFGVAADGDRVHHIEAQ